MATKNSSKKVTQTSKGEEGKRALIGKKINPKEMFFGQSPIIVTGGSCTMSATLHQFQDPDKKRTRNFEVVSADGGTAGKIISVTIRDGDTLYETVNISQSNDCVIEILYET